MPDGPEIEIVYRTKAELAGAQAVQQSLEKQIGAAKATGKEWKEMDAQLTRVNASLKANEAQQQSGLSAQAKANESLEGMNKVVGELAENIPGLGAALNAVTSPIGLIGSAVGLAVALFKDWQGNINKTADMLGNFTPEVIGFDAWPAVMAEAAASAAQFTTQLRAQETAFARVTTETGRQTEKLNARIAAEKQLIAAERDLAMARVDEDVRSGRITTAAASVARKEIRQNFGRQDIAADIGGLDEQGRLKRAELAALDERVRAAAKDLPAREAELAEKKAALKVQDDHERKFYPSLKAEAALLPAIRSELEDALSSGTLPTQDIQLPDKSFITSLPQAAASLASVKARQQTLSDIFDLAPVRRQERTTEIGTLEAEVGRLRGVTAAAAPGGAREQLAGEIGSLGYRRNVTASTAPVVAGIQEQAQGIRDISALEAEVISLKKTVAALQKQNAQGAFNSRYTGAVESVVGEATKKLDDAIARLNQLRSSAKLDTDR